MTILTILTLMMTLYAVISIFLHRNTIKRINYIEKPVNVIFTRDELKKINSIVTEECDNYFKKLWNEYSYGQNQSHYEIATREIINKMLETNRESIERAGERRIAELTEPEQFIDSVVERIRNKQL